ncbi:LysR family transcriptional regulator [Cupriavidus numazuensis]|uniref:HTH-type transcriptional regulator HdfR n=1 Tax=Cupriavidus numazuensis TaxID=221992 RepID=A0ABM8TQL9_9BURK|nr:LysR family transcriptional regulator [Cupriavidus numazuensis]CAG2158241.1 HTH-type transcriptional regulator HdfR [Cupriavidus numazuensis]
MSKAVNPIENVADLDMEAVQLLVSVSKLKSFKAAADQHRMTVSNVSSRIRKLEGTFGEQVLRRTTRKLELTQLGSRLVALGELVSRELASAEGELARIAGEFAGTLECSVSHSTLLPFLMPVVFDLAETNARLRIEVKVADDALSDHSDVRLGIVPRDSENAYPLAMVVCQAIRSAVAPELESALQLNEVPICILGHSLMPLTIDAVHKDGKIVRLQVVPSFMSTDVEILLHAVERGIGLGFLPKIVFDASASRDRFRVLLMEHTILSADTALSISVAPHIGAKAAAIFAAHRLSERLTGATS